jgi:uncharacterized membrane protein YqgA involved in biofilm formation
MNWIGIVRGAVAALRATTSTGRALGKSAAGLRRGRQSEVLYTLMGGALGMGVGMLFGGSIGVAALGGAFGLPILILAIMVGLIVGNRIGIEKDKKALAARLRARGLRSS